VIVDRTSITSRIGTGSSELLSNLIVIFIAETKHSAVAIRSNPRLASKNDDRAKLHCFCPVVRPGSSNGDVSSGVSPPSGGNNDACRVTGVQREAGVMMEGGEGLPGAEGGCRVGIISC